MIFLSFQNVSILRLCTRRTPFANEKEVFSSTSMQVSSDMSRYLISFASSKSYIRVISSSWRLACSLSNCSCKYRFITFFTTHIMHRHNFDPITSYKAESTHCESKQVHGQSNLTLQYGPMPNLMVALPKIGGALCSTPQSLADAHY